LSLIFSRLRFTKNIFFQSLAACILLLFPLWYNGSPLYYPDSFGYIFWGIMGKNVPERVASYAAFIQVFSFGISVWSCILIQGFLAAWIIRQLWAKILGLEISAYFYFTCFALGFGSSFGWTASMLMPDLFCAFSSILLFVLLFHRSKFSNAENALWIILFLAFSIQHVSIFLINCLICLIYFLIFLYNGKLQVLFRKSIIPIFLIFTSYAGIGFVHFSRSGEFFISKSSSTFLFARLGEMGLVSNYLNQKCANPGSEICQFKDRFPMGTEYFLWNENSPRDALGGLHDAHKIMGTANSEILSQPKFMIQFAQQAFKGAFKQFFWYGNGDGLGTGYTGDQLKFFATDFADFKMSKQSNGIPFSAFDQICYALLALLFFFAIRFKVIFGLSPEMKSFALFIIILLISNAFINGTFSTPLNRYQARVFWLVYLWLFAALFPTMKFYFTSSKSEELKT
jgi:hypothetical protein